MCVCVCTYVYLYIHIRNIFLAMKQLEVEQDVVVYSECVVKGMMLNDDLISVAPRPCVRRPGKTASPAQCTPTL